MSSHLATLYISKLSIILLRNSLTDYFFNRYGNTSSSSIWYEMDYIRQNMKLLRGQRVLQLAFGSGFKCNSAVWLSLRSGKSKRSSEESVEKKDQ